jgi:hypothetical protein
MMKAIDIFDTFVTPSLFRPIQRTSVRSVKSVTKRKTIEEPVPFHSFCPSGRETETVKENPGRWDSRDPGLAQSMTPFSLRTWASLSSGGPWKNCRPRS